MTITIGHVTIEDDHITVMEDGIITSEFDGLSYFK